MGQRLSHQAATATNKPSRDRYRPESRRFRRGKGSEKAPVGDIQPASDRSHRRERRSSPTRTTVEDQVTQDNVSPVQRADGDVRSSQRQQKNGRSKKQRDYPGTNNQNHGRVHQDQDHPEAVRIIDSQSQSTKTQSSKPGSRQSKTHPKKECIICTDTRSSHHFPDLPPTSQCTHDTNVCRRCLRTWIETSFSTKIWTELTCPVCASQLQHADVRALATKEVFRRYDKLTTKAHYESIPNWRWCIARGCSAGQVHGPNTLRFRCKTCQKSHCVECGVAWHEGETCAEHEYRTDKRLKKAEDAASKQLIAQTTKKCPGCGRSIEKTFGCDHMQCSRCRQDFCWQCLNPFVKKGKLTRVRHRRGCEHNEAGRNAD